MMIEATIARAKAVPVVLAEVIREVGPPNRVRDPASQTRML